MSKTYQLTHLVGWWLGRNICDWMDQSIVFGTIIDGTWTASEAIQTRTNFTDLVLHTRNQVNRNECSMYHRVSQTLVPNLISFQNNIISNKYFISSPYIKFQVNCPIRYWAVIMFVKNRSKNLYVGSHRGASSGPEHSTVYS